MVVAVLLSGRRARTAVPRCAALVRTSSLRFFRWAVAEGLINENPATGTERRRDLGRDHHGPAAMDARPSFARFKAMLRKAAERTVAGLWALIGKLVDIFRPAECANYFSSCGYDPA
ncbi:MAG: hypothetical protein JNM48_06630 [Rhodospirillales bacterium]|nr:hypothetical protein [Rhodospirillales bacterium]